MCGIFGFVRAEEAPDPALASRAFVALGHLAQERGRDAAGVALVGGRHDGPATAARGAIRVRRAVVDDCLVVKAGVPFVKLWYGGDGSLSGPLDRAVVAMGHCRFATRGDRHTVVNASPMVVGRLIGTHNGDIDDVALGRRYQLHPTDWAGSTDTEVLLAALASVSSEPKAITQVLGHVLGRAALAWIDRDDATRVHLARTALSPLSVARDCAGNFYWASNPGWFRVLDRKGTFGFRDIVAVREGSYLRVGGRFGPWIEAEGRFAARAREKDLYCQGGVWRGFDGADIRYERARATHTVVGRPGPSGRAGANGGAANRRTSRKTGTPASDRGRP